MKSTLSTKATDLLIIGAGPFGLAMAAHCRYLGINHIVAGKPMEFWQANMPKGLYLRSACNWHLDTQNVDTIENFLQTQGLTPADVEPLSLSFYLSYCRWFQKQKRIESIPSYVRQLELINYGKPLFLATMEDGQLIKARNIVVAVGFKYFRHEPQDLINRLPAGSFSHTCDLVDFTELRGKRCLIIGGRQSAFEWAALLTEAGADTVHLSYRHDSPAFAEADWSWVDPLIDAMVDDPGWFRNLSREDKEAVKNRFWSEGRLKVEPWLESRVRKDTVKLWPHTRLVSCDKLPEGGLAITLDNGERFTVDHVVLATGYKVDIRGVPFLSRSNISCKLLTRNGYPILDDHLQTTVPGLFFTSMTAAQDFGPFFAFTVSVRASAKLIGNALINSYK